MKTIGLKQAAQWGLAAVFFGCSVGLFAYGTYVTEVPWGNTPGAVKALCLVIACTFAYVAGTMYRGGRHRIWAPFRWFWLLGTAACWTGLAVGNLWLLATGNRMELMPLAFWTAYILGLCQNPRRWSRVFACPDRPK